MAIIPEQFMNAVVAIGIDQFDADGKRIWIGSGFIVERKELQNSNFSTYYIITNKHVIGNLRQIFMRFNSLSGAFVKDYNINLYDNMGHPLFSAHPNQGTDIIAIQFPYKDVLISQQTGEVQMVQTENSGLTIVHPVDRIKEVVEMEWRRNEQIRLAQQPQQTQALRQPEGATV